MNKSKQNITLALAGVLALGNVGLFIYDNVYIEKKEGSETVKIYAAKSEIKPNTVITEDLFVEIEIPKKGLLPTYVTDLSSAVGKSMSGSLKEYDILTNARLENKGYENQGSSYISLTPDVKVALSKNDTVVAYLRDKKSGSMEKLFENKMIIDSNADGTSYQILGSEEEVKLYYSAKVRGDIILVSVTEDYKEGKTSNAEVKENTDVKVQETNLTDTSSEN